MRTIDRRGIEGLPLQLLIIFIIIAIAIPLTWNYLNVYSERQTDDMIRDQFQYLESAVRDVYTMGPGNTRVVELEIDGAVTAKVNYLIIGGGPEEPWSNLSSCRYSISGQPVQYLMIRNPNVAMVNWSGGLEIGPGKWQITVESMDEWNLGLDVDGDGQYYSRFVEVGLSPYD